MCIQKLCAISHWAAAVRLSAKWSRCRSSSSLVCGRLLTMLSTHCVPRLHVCLRLLIFLHFASVVDDAKCILVTAICVSVCSSPHSDTTSQTRNGKGAPSSCALLGRFGIGARISLLWQQIAECEMSASACTRSMPGSLFITAAWFDGCSLCSYKPSSKRWRNSTATTRRNWKTSEGFWTSKCRASSSARYIHWPAHNRVSVAQAKRRNRQILLQYFRICDGVPLDLIQFMSPILLAV